ncbi:MAG: hypothetical protein ABJM58_10780 [Alteripontixanthobacter sp.]
MRKKNANKLETVEIQGLKLNVRQFSWPEHVALTDCSIGMRNFRYVNEDKIDSYLNQLGFDSRAKKSDRKLGLSGFTPSGSLGSSQSDKKIPIEHRVSKLVELLRDHEVITGQRPHYLPHHPTTEPPFVHEHCEAIPFIFPKSVFEHDLGISALKLWVSEPNKEFFVDEPFRWDGAYLLLTEVHFDNGVHRHMLSGCSALRLVFNALTNDNLLDRSGEEIFGRWDYRTITEKIMKMGGIPGSKLPIETLYAIRYMTDEQFHPDAPQDGRVHDILGYPFFISASV